MQKITVKLDGMSCGMCEAHVNAAIRQAFSVKKAVSSHTKGETVIICEGDITREQLEAALKDSGYRILAVTYEPYEKKGFSLFKK